jgi:hypothetical protein
MTEFELLGRWEVQMDVWTLHFVFHADHRLEWQNIDHPNRVHGVATWQLDSVLRITWPSGVTEEWNPPNAAEPTWVARRDWLWDLVFVRKLD